LGPRHDTGISRMTKFARLLRDQRGIGAIEYALVAMLIGVAALSAYANLGTMLQSRWTNSSLGKISANL
jgi:Flp pilus assembly pilin Flp